MHPQTRTLDRETVQAALAKALRRLPGIDGVFETTSGLMATSAGGVNLRITIAVDRPSTLHTVEIIDDAMVVLDRDGNGCDCHELRGLRETKRQQTGRRGCSADSEAPRERIGRHGRQERCGEEQQGFGQFQQGAGAVAGIAAKTAQQAAPPDPVDQQRQ